MIRALKCLFGRHEFVEREDYLRMRGVVAWTRFRGCEHCGAVRRPEGARRRWVSR